MSEIVQGSFRLIKSSLGLKVFKIEMGESGVQGSLYFLPSFGPPPSEIGLKLEVEDGNAYGLQNDKKK